MIAARAGAAAPAQPLAAGNGEEMFAAAAPRLIDWFFSEGRFLTDNGELLSALCERLAAAGVPLDRASLHLRALHPRYRGVSRIWKPGQPLAQQFLDHGLEKTATYLESPVREVTRRHRRLDWRLDSGDLLPFAILDELRDAGYVHYVIAPVPFAAGPVNALSWATKRPEGFPPEALRLMDALLPAYSTVAEAKTLVRFVETLLSTYVGHEPSQLILDGQIRRGDVRTITAAIMLIDLHDFTMLTNILSPRAVIRLLNEYFDCVFPPVRGQGGEVLEIMGDGVLAIFRQAGRDGGRTACRTALDAAMQALRALAERNRRMGSGGPVLQAGLALHYGTVSYGNIGSGDRLDFTVIGPDVNLTSRIEQFNRQLDRALIMSQAFAEQLDCPVWEIGHYELRGFAKRHRLFELPPEDWQL
ncbi:MAG: adenylate/guanylate cyclase domain-containing protein [Alphaproteobacteria bacterium]